MKFLLTFIFVASFIFLTAVSVHAAASPTPSPSPIFLGWMDLNGYCGSQGLGSSTLSGSTWNCTGNNQAINLNQACVWQYNVSNAYATQTRTGDPYSYGCFSNTQGLTPTPTPIVTGTKLGSMNLDGYCTNLNQGTSSLKGQTWVCSGNNIAINLNQACVWQYSNSNAYANQDVSGNPYSWNCYVSSTPTPTATPSPSPTPTVTPTTTLTPTPTGTVTRLGGMNLDGYCASIQEIAAKLNGQTWVCSGNNIAINLTGACVWQYNNSNAYANQDVSGNPYSWSCYVSATPTPSPSPTPTVMPTPSVTPIPGTTDDWPTYKYNEQRSSYNNLETIINANSAPNIKLDLMTPCATTSCSAFAATPGAVISDSPAVVNNVMYYGDWTGNFFAKSIDGSVIWSRNLGVMTPPSGNNCTPKSVGVVSSPSVKSISVNGIQTPIVYIAGADGFMYALYASNGNVLWKTQLADPSTGALLWDSPVEFAGNVYVGLSSFGDCPLVQGKLFSLNWSTGTINNTAKLVPDGCVGAGEWASPTVDTTNNKIYITTGTQDNSCVVNGQPYVEPYALAMVELDLNLNILGSWRIPQTEQITDSDFGVSPVLTTAVINGINTQLVSGGNKNGRFYIFKRDAISQGPIVDEVLGQGGTCPDCGNGTISSSATDGITLYQGTGSTTVNGVNYKATVVALNPANGAIIWQHGLPHALVATPTLVNGILIAPEGNNIDLINPSNGNEIFQITHTGTNSVFDSPAAVARGKIFIGNLNGNFYEYGF